MKLGGVIFTSWKDMVKGNYKAYLCILASLYVINQNKNKEKKAS